MAAEGGGMRGGRRIGPLMTFAERSCKKGRAPRQGYFCCCWKTCLEILLSDDISWKKIIISLCYFDNSLMPPKGGQRNFRQGLSGLVDLMAYSVALFIYYYVLQESISSLPVFSSFSTHLSHKAQGHQQHHQSQHQSQTV